MACRCRFWLIVGYSILHLVEVVIVFELCAVVMPPVVVVALRLFQSKSLLYNSTLAPVDAVLAT